MSINDLQTLHQCYPTNSGLAYLSERSIFRGKNLHDDLNHLSWFELNLFGITGRRYSAIELKILNYIWLSTSYSDIRIWPNRIAALASSARSTPIMSLVGGISSCDAELFVAKPLVSCLSMYLQLKKRLDDNEELDAELQKRLDNNETIYGFGRPISSIDERVPHLVLFLNSMKKDTGYFFKLAFKIEDFLKRKKNIQMNIAALYAAVCADLGFNEVEMNLFVSLLVVAGMPPCYLDTLEKPPGSILPIKCDDVKYTGKPSKKWSN
ncbi:citrate/2-methylcitrate synthase [Aliikangiella sp. IMCC44359]|uniref:citrate/2-methylcitrate synthase n=1 Tax=Aliikangiella sp. IMCC44359 TaxID=3459125 RepID=UPI00403AB8AD